MLICHVQTIGVHLGLRHSSLIKFYGAHKATKHVKYAERYYYYPVIIGRNWIVEETLGSTVNCIIVAVFLLKIVRHYVPFENQPDDPLKKLSIFFYLSCQIGYFFRKFKIFKKIIDGTIIKHLTLLKPVSNFFFQKKFFLTFLCKPKGQKWRKCIFLKYIWTKINPRIITTFFSLIIWFIRSSLIKKMLILIILTNNCLIGI